ncbi:hypothetical protein SDC9_116639 [bioreactor metagenome]|uniref:GGDEF domain-containing protein n=1 Tax=bioreactor metagenome TaxID=1076179 RepID=A0A645BYG6_9ZZZZ
MHSAFTATYYFFAIAVILTTVYLSYRITAVTALLGITALGISELFVKWDADKVSVFESTLRMSNFLISLFILIACAVVCMVEIRYERKKNEASIQIEMERRQLKRILQLDELTGIFNRKSLHDALKDMEENAPDDRYILAITDIDNFKGVNDRFGHQAGDHCLMEFSKILKEHGKNASIFRYGGDEFCLIFHHAEIQKAVSVCEQIQSRLSGLHFEAYPGLKLTASFGLASYFSQTNAARLFVYADKALYEAKEERNAIRVFSPEDRPAEYEVHP